MQAHTRGLDAPGPTNQQPHEVGCALALLPPGRGQHNDAPQPGGHLAWAAAPVPLGGGLGARREGKGHGGKGRGTHKEGPRCIRYCDE